MVTISRKDLQNAFTVSGAIPETSTPGSFEYLDRINQRLEESKQRLVDVMNEEVEIPSTPPDGFLEALKEKIDQLPYAKARLIKPLYDAYTAGTDGNSGQGDTGA